MAIKQKIMGGLNAWGPAMMIVIAIIPIGGLMLGIGTFMQNETFMEAAPWLASGIVYGFSSILKAVGNLIIGNLPVLFCVAISEGLSDHDGTAAFAGFVGYMVFNTVIASFLGITAETVAENSSAYTTVLGVSTLQTGVLGGMAVAILTSQMYKRFKSITLPDAISFFQGKRFVPIVNVLACAILAIPFALIWPVIQSGIDALSYVFMESNNPVALYIYGLVTRILIPFGLHNVWYPPFYFQFGSYTTLAGNVVHGDLNIFLAQIADGAPITAGSIVGGCYLMPAFCVGAALAISKMAKPENRKKTLGLFTAGIATCILTGITEPIEFVFLFSCPLLYAIHACFLSLAWPILSILGVHIGTTFCGGLMDWLVYGVLQNAPGWALVIPVNIIVGVIYYFIFKAIIKIFDFKTPGREDDVNETADSAVQSGELAKSILNALGGKENIKSIDACATRLRVQLNNNDIDTSVFKDQLHAKGVMNVGSGIQIIYGTQAATLKEEIKAIIEGREVSVPEARMVAAATIDTKEEFVVPVSGELMDITKVPDDTFAKKMMGIGFAIQPDDGKVVSPVTGTITTVFPTKHAIGITSDQGKEIILHLGLETVALNGKPFDIFVKDGDVVDAGTPIAQMNVEQMEEQAKSSICICIVTNMEHFDVVLDKEGKVNCGDRKFMHFKKIA